MLSEANWLSPRDGEIRPHLSTAMFEGGETGEARLMLRELVEPMQKFLPRKKAPDQLERL